MGYKKPLTPRFRSQINVQMNQLALEFAAVASETSSQMHGSRVTKQEEPGAELICSPAGLVRTLTCVSLRCQLCCQIPDFTAGFLREDTERHAAHSQWCNYPPRHRLTPPVVETQHLDLLLQTQSHLCRWRLSGAAWRGWLLLPAWGVFQ